MAREILFDLGKMITDRIPYKLGLKRLTETDPEYIILDRACSSDEIAEIMLKMGLRKPKTTAEIAKLTGKSEERVVELLTDAAEKGIVEYNWENPQHEKQWYVQLFVPGIAEMTNMVLWQVEKYPELADSFDKMTFLPLEGKTHLIPPGGDGIGMHVLPVEKAINAENKSVSIEHISHWLDKYDGKLSVGYCSCRNARRLYGQGSGEIQDDCCIGLGDFAEYLIETGKGRPITKQEALDICKRAEDNGYVHQITNIDGVLRPAHQPVLQHPEPLRLRLPRPRQQGQLRGLRQVRRGLPGRRRQARPEAVHQKRRGQVPAAGAALRPQVGQGQVQPQLRRRQPQELPRVRHRALQDRIQGYIKLAKEGRYLDALKLIKQDNPFPSVCGYVCNRRCEDACTRGAVDKAVAIDEIKKFIAEQDLKSEDRYIPAPLYRRPIDKPYEEKVAIIGAGPAGLSCAYYLARMGYVNVTVFDRNPAPGGMLVMGIPTRPQRAQG